MTGKRYVYSALVENRPGVLSRVSGLFTRRGYNIDSLTVAETENPAYSRMTIALHSDENTAVQIRRQLEKLIDVISIAELTPNQSVTREHVLIKIAADADSRMAVISLTNISRQHHRRIAPEHDYRADGRYDQDRSVYRGGAPLRYPAGGSLRYLGPGKRRPDTESIQSITSGGVKHGKAVLCAGL